MPKCPNQAGHWPEEDYLAAIRSKGGVYMRFYESWMGFGETDVDCWANWLENALWETSQGLPFTVRWDMGMFNGTDAWLEFGMAAFLMAQGDLTVTVTLTHSRVPHGAGRLPFVSFMLSSSP